ncbi:diguanylate cyclase [Massilia sp. H-1]|nr:diguanylate cyclase [Massilia sp. H-1]
MSLLILIQLWLGIRLYGQVALRDRLEKERRSLQKLLVKKSRSLRRQALKDALTGIANRRQFDTRLLREFNRAATEGPLSLVILDVDYFKKYNDQHGHPVGDECLKAVVSCINNGRRRSQDLAARLGGEEFAILLPDTDLRGAIAVAESVRKTVAARHGTHQRHAAQRDRQLRRACRGAVAEHGAKPTWSTPPTVRSTWPRPADATACARKASMPPGSTKRFSLVINK